MSFYYDVQICSRDAAFVNLRHNSRYDVFTVITLNQIFHQQLNPYTGIIFVSKSAYKGSVTIESSVVNTTEPAAKSSS